MRSVVDGSVVRNGVVVGLTGLVLALSSPGTASAAPAASVTCDPLNPTSTSISVEPGTQVTLTLLGVPLATKVCTTSGPLSGTVNGLLAGYSTSGSAAQLGSLGSIPVGTAASVSSVQALDSRLGSRPGLVTFAAVLALAATAGVRRAAVGAARGTRPVHPRPRGARHHGRPPSLSAVTDLSTAQGCAGGRRVGRGTIRAGRRTHAAVAGAVVVSVVTGGALLGGGSAAAASPTTVTCSIDANRPPRCWASWRPRCARPWSRSSRRCRCRR